MSGYPCALEPTRGELGFAVGHVLSAENAQAQHFCRGEFREKIGIEVPSHGCGARVAIALLHSIVNDHFDNAVHLLNLALQLHFK